MTEWWRGATIYQIYPRSYQDSTGDGVGDLAGIARRLEHVARLGADGIWLSPFFPSPMKDMGYDVADYTGVDPMFGTMEDFDALLARAHELGLKVVIDQVLSHTSDRHPWFRESREDRTNPKADWYVWADPREDGMPPNNWPAVFGGPAWHWNARRRQYYLHNFLPEQPDLNLHNTAVQDALLDAMRFWLDRGVDGFRLDTVNFYFHDQSLRSNPADPSPPPGGVLNPYDAQVHTYSKNRPENLAFLRRMRSLLDEYGERMLIGEVGEAHRAIELMAEYTGGGDKLHMAYSFEMLSKRFGARHFRSCIEEFFAAAPDGWPSWSFSNHDVRRHVSRWLPEGGDPDGFAKGMIALLVSLQGSIGIYQNEETGQVETQIAYDELTDPQGFQFWPEVATRDGCRTPMVWEDAPNGGFCPPGVKPWLPVKAPQRARSVASQEGVAGSVLEFYRAALAFRRERAVLRRGNTAFLDLPEPVLGFVRRGKEGDGLLCLFNLSGEPRSLRVTGAGAPAGPEGAARPEAGRLDLGPYGFAWMEAGAATPEVAPA